jgi:DNA-binding protein HU-beta
MSLNQAMDLFGFFRPIYKGAGFAIPIFCRSADLFVQVIEGDKIVDFIPCAVGAKDLINCASTQLVVNGHHVASGAAPLRRGVGDPAWYAFQRSSRTFLLDGRLQLATAIKLSIPRSTLKKNPFLAVDVAEFRGDDRKAAKERLRAHAWLAEDRPKIGKRQRVSSLDLANQLAGVPTRAGILAQISKETDLSRKQISQVFDSLSASIEKSLRSHGLFTLPGLLKMKVVKRRATKARPGVNPFTGEKMLFKAKPASKKVRIAALKTLKEFVK